MTNLIIYAWLFGLELVFACLTDGILHSGAGTGHMAKLDIIDILEVV